MNLAGFLVPGICRFLELSPKGGRELGCGTVNGCDRRHGALLWCLALPSRAVKESGSRARSIGMLTLQPLFAEAATNQFLAREFLDQLAALTDCSDVPFIKNTDGLFCS